MTNRDDGLELHTDMGFVRREWQIERVAWGVMLLIVIAAALGLFGAGVLSTSSVSSEDGVLHVDYSRFVRVTASTQLDLEVGPEAVEDGSVQLAISHEYLAAVDIEHILPEPSSATTSAEGVIYTIDIEGDIEGGTPALITIEVEPTGFGPHAGNLGVVGGPDVRLRQFVYP